MTSIPEATAAGGEITLGGKTYKLRPLSWRDIGFYERWMRGELIASAREACRSAENEQERIGLLEAAYQQAGRLSLFSKDGIGFHQSVNGLMKLAYLSLKADQPRMTEEDVFAMLAGKDDLEAMMTKIREMNETIFGSPVEKKPEAGPDKADSKSQPAV